MMNFGAGIFEKGLRGTLVWGRLALGAALAIPLLLLFLFAVLVYGNQIVDGVGNSGVRSALAVGVVIAIGVALLFMHIIRSREPYPARLFLGVSVPVAAALYYAYISSIDVVWISDFKGMWEHAVRMVSTGDYTVRNIYNERALPVLVPLILLFGAKGWLVPFANLLMLVGIQLAGYDLARRIAGHRAAQGFVVLWLGAMEPTMALPITSHDIWGLFYLTMFLWGFRVLDDSVSGMDAALRWRRPWWLIGVVALAVLLTILDMQRELAPFVILGGVLAFGLVTLREGRIRDGLGRTALLAGLIVLLHLGTAMAMKAGGVMLTSEQGAKLSQIRIGAYSSTLGNGKYAQGQAVTKAFFNTDDTSQSSALVRAIPLSDFASQPLARVGNVIHRVQGQAQLGSQYYFYQSEAKAAWHLLVPLTRAYNVAYSVMLSLLALCVVLPVIRRAGDVHVLLQLGFLSTLVGVLVLAGESQPRYVFPLWFVAPQLISIALSKQSILYGKPFSLGSVWGWDVTKGVAIALLLFLGLSFAFRLVYTEARGRILSGWSGSVDGVVQGSIPPNWFRINQRMAGAAIKKAGGDTRVDAFGSLAVVLRFPSQVPARAIVSAEKRVCIGQDRRTLDFHYFMPYQNPIAQGAFTFEALVDGQVRWGASLPGTPAIQHASIADILPPGECGEIAFRLTTNRALPRASWVNASQVDIYFPRMSH